MTHSCTVALNTVTKIEKTFPLSQVKPIFKRMKTKNGAWDTLSVLQPVFFIFHHFSSFFRILRTEFIRKEQIVKVSIRTDGKTKLSEVMKLLQL